MVCCCPKYVIFRDTNSPSTSTVALDKLLTVCQTKQILKLRKKELVTNLNNIWRRFSNFWWKLPKNGKKPADRAIAEKSRKAAKSRGKRPSSEKCRVELLPSSCFYLSPIWLELWGSLISMGHKKWDFRHRNSGIFDIKKWNFISKILYFQDQQKL